MPKACRLMIRLEDGETLGPFCRVRDARKAVECLGKVRLVPAEPPRCERAWEVSCEGETVGDACEVPRGIPQRWLQAYVDFATD
jgi:hypothetical protein